MADKERNPEWRERLEDALADMTRAQMDEFCDELTTIVIETCKEEPNAYPGIKVPVKGKALKFTRKSLAELLFDWSGA